MRRQDDRNRSPMTRRTLLRSTAAAAVTVGAMGPTGTARADDPPRGTAVSRGRLKQSACRWCYGRLPIDDLAAAAREMGLVGLDLMKPDEFDALKRHGLVCTMTSTHGLTVGLNDPKNHEECLKAIHEAIEATAREGWRNVITFSGNRNGMDDRAGLEHCAKALREIVPVAEQAGVIINMELLNSKVDHPDYMCDRSDWGVELVKRVGSDHFKMLYDIYHMQIMEGDVIRTIEANHPYFGHYHTAGNPGRNELDDTQELNYPPICRAIVDTGFDGYLAQEFIPKRDPLTSLAEAVALCDV
jgi:hydroxypyruvate isomerase